jgi:NADH-quinone oxidoreductase subunit M
MQTLLLVTLLLPAAAAILTGLGRKQARCWALAASLATLAGAIVLVANFPIEAAGSAGRQDFALTHWSWFAALDNTLDIHFSIGLDGLSLWLFALTALLLVVAVLVSWTSIKDQEPLYYRLLLLLGTGMLGVFVARDIILFYLFFEFTLVPLFFLIGIWGSDQRRYAAIKFFLFTLAGSVLTLLGLLAIVFWVANDGGKLTFSIPALIDYLQHHSMPYALQVALFFALFAGFAIKVPLFPLHTWLPLAHVEAPAAGSILLAGVLLKIGTYGFLRFSLPMLPLATAAAMPCLLWLAVAGIIYGALVALAQSDLKRLIAYSSVSHLGFCMLGIFALNRVAVQGGALQMINHGLSTGGLFALVGMLYQRYHTRQIAAFGGIARETPVLAFFMLFMTLASIGLPGLNGFVGEFLLLLGMFQRAWGAAASPWTAQYHVISVLATSGVVLGAWYMLSLVKRVFFGPLQERKHAEPIADLGWHEIWALVPLCLVIVWIGVQPKFFLDRMAPCIDQLTGQAMLAADERGHASRHEAAMVRDDVKENAIQRGSPAHVNEEDLTPRRQGAKAREYSLEAIGGGTCRFSSVLTYPTYVLRLCALAPLRENPFGRVIPCQQSLADRLWHLEGEGPGPDQLATEPARVP